MEDNPADVQLVRLALDHHDVNASLVVESDGEHMLQHIERIDRREVPCPDIVLLDLNLPRVNGHTILNRLRQSPVCGHVPIIIVSSSNAPGDRENASRLGATNYFCKPNNYDDFLRLGALISDYVK
ncbi:MAG TPA: response regulator [Bryobacteraceae bacterium]|nr:response regulator [Bryobacteraceae bacterium]